jgi:hypothetical protein
MARTGDDKDRKDQDYDEDMAFPTGQMVTLGTSTGPMLVSSIVLTANV